MKRTLRIALLLTLLASITGFVWVSRRGVAHQVQLNTKDIPGRGLTLLNATHPDFYRELHRFLAKNKRITEAAVERAKLVSVLLKNNSPKDVIAYKIKWEIVKEDGTVFQQHDSFADPEILMGVELATKDDLNGIGYSIKPQEARLIVWGGLGR